MGPCQRLADTFFLFVSLVWGWRWGISRRRATSCLSRLAGVRGVVTVIGNWVVGGRIGWLWLDGRRLVGRVVRQSIALLAVVLD